MRIEHLLAFAGLLALPAFGSASDSTLDSRLDSIENALPYLEQKVRSTLMFGGSSPVSFSGEARVRLQYHNFTVFPDYLGADRSYLQSGWEGNEGAVRVGMVARPGRNTVLWAKWGFQSTLPGHTESYVTDDGGFRQVQSLHDKTNAPTYIHEDLSAGIAIRTRPASFWLKLGNVNWVEASPLTIWKSQPRLFAWEYLPFEIEQPIARYYEYNIAKGEKSGRAAWHKKAFNGLNLESISLPRDLYVNFLYARYEAYDKGEREAIDLSNDLAYADAAGATKGLGVGDSYLHILHARVALPKAIRDVGVGLNFNQMLYTRDIANAGPFKKVFDIDSVMQTIYRVRVWGTSGIDTVIVNSRDSIDTNISVIMDSSQSFIGYQGRGFYKQPTVFSLDFSGNLTPRLGMQADVALSMMDTTWLAYDTSMSYTSSSVRGPVSPAFYGRLTLDGKWPLVLDIAAIGRDFYSPFSMVAPADAFFAFGSNMVGPGKFLAGGEGAPYAQNMAGAQLGIARKLAGYGHLKLLYGQHAQLEPARDLLYFPYRLNGPDFFSVFHSSYNRWGNDLVDHSISYSGRPWYDEANAYNKRLGDESFLTSGFLQPSGPDAGGMRSHYLSIYEGFVPYESAAQADSNMANVTGLYDRSPWVPQHRKWTFNLELDGSYDISQLIGYPRDLFVGGYAAINGVTTEFRPLTFNEKSDASLLWSVYLRFEPAIALTKRFYVIGLAGFENWRSAKAYMADSTGRAFRSPIDFRDYALGLGFDWEMLERVGVHVRGKWMQHDDIHHSRNNWQTPVVSAEIKMWY